MKSMRILVATNSPSKLTRVRHLLSGTGVECVSPADLGIEAIEVEEGSDLHENAERKARAYLGKTELPILGMDSAFVIPGEDLDPAKVKRNALGSREESAMTQEEIAQAMVGFYRGIVSRHGGNVPAYWEDVFAMVLPDGGVKREQDRRPVILTAEIVGKLDPHMPLRSMYIVESTGKYVADHTPDEEFLEMKPFQDALQRLLGIS